MSSCKKGPILIQPTIKQAICRAALHAQEIHLNLWGCHLCWKKFAYYLKHSDSAISHLKAKRCSEAGLLIFLPQRVVGMICVQVTSSDCVPVEPCLPVDVRGVNSHETFFDTKTLRNENKEFWCEILHLLISRVSKREVIKRRLI